MGNIVDARDMSVLSAIEFAVETLGVKHIIIRGICFLVTKLIIGHSQCAACATVFEKKKSSVIADWLRPIHNVRVAHAKELDSIPNVKRVSRLIELKLFQ